MRKPVFGVSDQVRNQLGFTATVDGNRLELSDFESRGVVLSMSQKQKRGYHVADLQLCYRICKSRVSHDRCIELPHNLRARLGP